MGLRGCHVSFAHCGFYMLLSLSGEDIIKCLIVLCSVGRPVI